MLNFFLFVLFSVGAFNIIQSITKVNIIANAMDDRFYGRVIDEDLHRKIKVIDRLRITKWLFALTVGITLIVHTMILLTNSASTILFVVLCLVMALIKDIMRKIYFKKYKINSLYDDIKEQWKSEKKVSERHDEEVAFVRGYDDVVNTFYYDTCCLISSLLVFFII